MMVTDEASPVELTIWSFLSMKAPDEAPPVEAASQTFLLFLFQNLEELSP
jgi:hypothetical protein